MRVLKAIEWIKTVALMPLTPKHLRISAILIAIYQVLVAHVILFVMLMGLAHAEEMRTILGIDIADQKEREDYYEVVTNAKGESLNQIRFKSASHLASFTLLILYIGTVVASVNLFSSLGLFIGVFKNKTELMLPWLVLDMLGVVIILAIMIFVANGTFVCFVGGQWQYMSLCVAFILFDIIIWYTIYCYYISIRQIRKLTEIATVAIPCPPPGSIPFHYRKENMYLGSGGYKHILADCDPNYQA
ncbi:unnamed protein product [Hermetia illucens]|uniref:Uncharacterized protein n=2 Tax=Hermetia illucens TaxID=343691 RepID=A0A7R8YR77_HERIL|nr:unnamed protein product [Hermetia illucens]